MKLISGKTVAVTVGIICILLTATLITTTNNYDAIVNAKDNTLTLKDATISELTSQILAKDAQISEQDSQIQAVADQNTELQTWLDGNITDLNAQISVLQNQTAALTSQIESLHNNASSLSSQITNLQNQTLTDQSTITSLQSQVTTASSQIDSLNSANNGLKDQVEDLTSIINMSETQLQTLVFHVCDKGDESVWKLPNVTATYEQILDLNNGTYAVLLLPEYKAHLNWTEELSWLAANFGGKDGIPIMLDVFASAEGTNPVTKLSTDNISQAMAVCNVQFVRIFEAISWHIDHQLPFPTDYVTSLLDFCRANGLKVFWSEWKQDCLPDVRTFADIQNYIAGYEDIVTVSFGTNSKDAQPPDGFLELRPMFPHWGASVQPWYAHTYFGADPLDMPPYLLVQHALSAKQIGAEIIQIEPYWYFFNNGQANENLKLLLTMLK